MALSLVLALWPRFAASQTPAGGSPSATPRAASAQKPPDQAQAELRALIDSGTLAYLRWPNFADFQASVSEFYELGGYSIAWIRNDQPTAQAKAMIGAFKEASLKGLNAEDYDASRWDVRLAKVQSAARSPTEVQHFDLALTVCAMRYISALRVGRVNPQHFKFEINSGSAKYDLAQFLRDVLQASDMDEKLAQVEPQFLGYERAEAALATYLKLAAEGDGDPLPIPSKTVRPGDTYPAMSKLVRRLRQLGDLSEANADTSTVYQGTVLKAVEHFQSRHGLEPDGLLGKSTIIQINKPLSFRMRQLQFALERYRWLPPNFPQPPILVNIPQFELRTMRAQGGGFVTMNVVVGRAYRHQTPVFTNEIRYVIFRPYWNVPLSIQMNELVPKIRRNPDYLADHQYEVVNRSGRVVTDGTVTGNVMGGLSSGELMIRQKPGPKNALGLVKFMFPNTYDVYLHGTPQVRLFSRARRDFSHGCIRLQDPLMLAAWVLRDQSEWSENKIRAAMNGDQTIQVNVTKPVPILILYSTAVVEPDGEVRFFDDIYGHDASLEKALDAGYPYP